MTPFPSPDPGPLEKAARGYITACFPAAALMSTRQYEDIMAAFVMGAVTYQGFLMNGLSEGDEVRPMDEALMLELGDEAERLAQVLYERMGGTGILRDAVK